MITWRLRNEDLPVNEKCIQRLMRLMGLMPIYQKPININVAGCLNGRFDELNGNWVTQSGFSHRRANICIAISQ
ncbi:hypothetical protein [Ruegeria atlantica]|uniref:hypothetical protein n=1 Tax=Ruegeria atlantica TaxID=81569 RepID=UPI003D7D32CC